MNLGPTLIQYDHILTWIHLQRTYFQIRSRSQVPEVRTRAYLATQFNLLHWISCKVLSIILISVVLWQVKQRGPCLGPSSVRASGVLWCQLGGCSHKAWGSQGKVILKWLLEVGKSRNLLSLQEILLLLLLLDNLHFTRDAGTLYRFTYNCISKLERVNKMNKE